MICYRSARLATTLRTALAALATFAWIGIAATSHAVEPLGAEEIVFLAEYIGADYTLAVRRGEIADPFEYREMRQFSDRLLEAWKLRPESTTAPDITDALVELRAAVRNMDPEPAVREISTKVVPRLAEALRVDVSPALRPDLGDGREIYDGNCASCHGRDGRGNGSAGEGLRPPPSSFLKPRMNRVSPHQSYLATSYGIEGTAMPGFADELDSQQRWNVSFFLQTLREGFHPEAPPPGSRTISLRQLSSRANADLLADLTDADTLTIRQLDHHRAFPPPPRRPLAATTSGQPRTESADSKSSALDVALGLEEAFAEIVQARFPSVVGVVGYTRTALGDETPPREPAAAPGWLGVPEDVARKGYRVVGLSSGFFVSTDGAVLTRYLPLLDPDTGSPVTEIHVVTANDQRYPARLVGAEPSIDLAVLHIVVPFPTTVAPMADSALTQPGRWALLLADPPGVARTFMPGNIAAVPIRECYQERRGGTLFQTSLRAGRDSFGGPVVDIRGRVIGMAVPPLAPTEWPAPVFILPNKLAMTIYDAIWIAKSRHSPWLGISVLELSRQLRQTVDRPPRTGVYIDGVYQPGPASAAGVGVGDVLTAIDDNPLYSVGDFQRWLYLRGVGAKIVLHISRNGRTLEFPVTIRQRPADAAMRDG